MASSARGRQLSRTHHAALAGLSAKVVAELLLLWRLLDVENVDGSMDRWIAAVVTTLRRDFGTSTTLAARYYRRFRLAETGRPLSVPVAAAEWIEESVRAQMVWAGPGELFRRLAAGVPPERASELAASFMASMGQLIVADANRDTVTDTVRTDPVAVGYARKTDGNPCAFCALMASRGPVYKSQQSASFRPHRRCGCTAEPVFSRSQAWPDGARDWRKLYRESTRGSTDPINAFRRAYETHRTS